MEKFNKYFKDKNEKKKDITQLASVYKKYTRNNILRE